MTPAQLSEIKALSPGQFTRVDIFQYERAAGGQLVRSRAIDSLTENERHNVIAMVSEVLFCRDLEDADGSAVNLEEGPSLTGYDAIQGIEEIFQAAGLTPEEVDEGSL